MPRSGKAIRPYIALDVVIKTVCGKDAAVEPTKEVLTACLENDFQGDSA
ncbi:MAG: hypothetical protein R3F37_19055 [Candidatus Competibacteraceae bacterium]